MLASDEIAWKDRNCRAWVSLSFALTRLRVVRLLSKADLCFLLQSLLGACARPPRQVAPKDQAVTIGLGWTSRRER